MPSLLLFLQDFLEISNLLIKFHQLSSSFSLQYSKMITLIDSSSAYFFEKFQMIQLIATLIVLSFACNTSPKLYIPVLLIHYINLQFCLNDMFYFHSLVTILMLQGGIGTILILNFGCTNLR